VRVAFLSVSGKLGGSEMMLLQILRELTAADRQWDLHLVVPAAGPLGARASALGVSVHVVAMPDSLRTLGEWATGRRRPLTLAAKLAHAAVDLPGYSRRLGQLLAAINADVIHTNGFKAHVVAARAHGFGAALVWHMHEYVAGRPVTRALVRRYARRCQSLVAVSESVAADLRSVAGPDAPVSAILNAVDLDRFAPAGHAADLDRLAGLPPAPPGTVRVGLVATFSRWKGHDVFLRALAALPDTSRVRGYVVGGAVYDTAGSQHSRDELTARAAELGIAHRVGFTGFVAEAEQAIRALDVVVHASTDHEAFGLVIAEAMACGRPVVTSGTGGSAELVRDGEDAVTHRAGDAADLAARLALLAADEPLRRRLGGSARETAARRFDAHRLAGQFATVYERAARQRLDAAR
jgi:glycosyltransferase involved in cell wall biosynthesis